MNRTHNLFRGRLLLVALAPLCLLACGGADKGATHGGSAATASVGSEPSAARLSADSSLMRSDPRAVPADPGAWTRAGRYASASQAEQIERVFGAAAISVRVEGSGIEGLEQTLGIVYGVQAAHDLPREAPILLRAQDLRLGAAVANRLAEGGYSRVWLVTP